MKSFKISDSLSVKMCESIEDINIKRWTAIKAISLLQESGMGIPSLRDTFLKIRAEFDKQSPSGMLLELHDFLLRIEKIEHEEDPDQMMFALITLEEGEDPTSTDSTLLKEKLERYAQAGLTQEAVVKEVANFITGLTSN